MNSTKYGITSLRKQFPNDDVILDFLFDTLHSRECSCGGTYKRIKGRKQYQCSKCRNQIAPTAGTIFHKSDTPLTLWFHAIMVFSNAKSGISAKTMQRDLEVTYKTAWRMYHLIRKALEQSDDKLSGDVEIDAGFFGGKGNAGKNNERLHLVMKKKSVVMAAVERGGKMKAKVVPDTSAKTHRLFVLENIEPEGTRLMTDSTKALNNIALGYDRHMVDHP